METKPKVTAATRKVMPDLSGFCGADELYAHSIRKRSRYTLGVKFLATECGCYWLIDAIILSQTHARMRGESFQLWTLEVHPDLSTALLKMTADKDSPIIYQQKIDWTDFPPEGIKLYYANDVLMLPQEY